MCAVHGQDPDTFTPAALWDETSSVDGVATKLSSLVLNGGSKSSTGPHIFDLIHKIQSDKSFEFSTPTLSLSDGFHAKYAPQLKQMIDEWLPVSFASDPGVLKEKSEEAMWLNTLIYGVGGWSAAGGKGYLADFATYDFPFNYLRV